MDNFYQRLLKFTRDGIYRYTFDDGRIIFANQGIVDIFELDITPEALIGKQLSDVMIYTQKTGTIRQTLERYKEIHNFEYHFKTLSGTDKWVIHDSFIFENPDGTKIVEAIVKDITERKNNEIKNFEEKERLRVTLSSIGDAVIATDTEGKITLINHVAESMTGFAHDEATGKPLNEVFKIINQNTGVLSENPVEKVLKTGTVVRLANHTILISRSGAELIIADSGAPICDRDGKIIGVILVFRDVTEQCNIEDALRESNEYLEKLLNYANAPIMVWDSSFNITYFNHAFEQLSGYDASEVISKKIDVLFKINKIDVSLETIKNATGRKRSESVEIEILRKDNEIKIALWNFANILDKDGKNVVATIAQGQDITDRKKAEQKIIEFNATLEQRIAKRTADLEFANKELEAFAYSVSHDLRTPLRAIEGFSGFLIEDYYEKLDDEGKRLLNVIKNSAQKMDRLITDLLLLSRVIRSEVTYSVINMNDLVNLVYSEAAPPEVLQKFNFSAGEIKDAFGDIGLIKQVWFNLISNAIKYTMKSEIKKIEIGGIDENEKYVYFVKDTGVGFNPEYKNKLFGVFQRLHNEEEFEGNGIGLTLVQRIIHRHGGRVWAEGKLNGGATFYFSMPKKEND